MTDLEQLALRVFVPRQRTCHCRAGRVDASDIAERVAGRLSVHGLFHCFAVESARSA